MSMERRLESIAAKLRQAASRGLSPFGAATHGFRMEPPVSEEDVAALESLHEVTLPNEYRAFITKVSAGGAGPAYGLTLFGQAQLPDDAPSTFLRTAFPHEEAFGVGEESLAEDPLASAGTLRLCHEGCGHIHRLVCTGPAGGQVWLDSTVSEGGFRPLGVGFLDWYERWLDAAIEDGDGLWWVQRDDAESDAAEARAMLPWWRRWLASATRPRRRTVQVLSSQHHDVLLLRAQMEAWPSAPRHPLRVRSIGRLRDGGPRGGTIVVNLLDAAGVSRTLFFERFLGRLCYGGGEDDAQAAFVTQSSSLEVQLFTLLPALECATDDHAHLMWSLAHAATYASDSARIILRLPWGRVNRCIAAEDESACAGLLDELGIDSEAHQRTIWMTRRAHLDATRQDFRTAAPSPER